MRTAYCFTPDRAFFAAAVRAIASLIDAEPDVKREIFLLCAPDDVLPGFDKLPASLRERIKLMTLDFSRFDLNLAGRGRFSRAVFRRLFLDQILPAHFERIVSVDSDMLIVRDGLKRLESFDLGGRPLAAVRKDLDHEYQTSTTPLAKVSPAPRFQQARALDQIERMFARLKDFRRVATRYDKLANNFLAGVLIAAIVIWWLN